MAIVTNNCKRPLKFIDLFAGLGGCHLALKQLGHECVFASELDPELRTIYAQNFRLVPSGDIREIPLDKIPTHQILCAGFPCQPFSKAGEQDGFDCPTWGDLFNRAVAILKHHQPEFVLLENVPNLMKHDKGKTWEKVVRSLKRVGYDSDAQILSPHQFGVPQIRERVYIVARRGGLGNFQWPKGAAHRDLHINSVLDCNPSDAKPLTKQVVDCMQMWQRFISAFPKREDLPTFPIWAMEFGATYPYRDFSPASMKRSELREYRGAYGKSLAGVSDAALVAALPPYARAKGRRFPAWKIEFIRKNRALYRKHKKWIDKWRHEILEFPPSLQKLEWNCKGGERDIWKYIIQFRASGVRVKKPTRAPSLIAMTVTQVPIIAWESRYMTPRECAKLQSMEDLEFLPSNSTSAYKALGNAINVRVTKCIAAALVGTAAIEGRAFFKAKQIVPATRRRRVEDAVAA